MPSSTDPSCSGRNNGGRMLHTGRSPRMRYNDLWIAAQAIEHGYVLMTLNVADLADLPGVTVVVQTSAGTS